MVSNSQRIEGRQRQKFVFAFTRRFSRMWTKNKVKTPFSRQDQSELRARATCHVLNRAMRVEVSLHVSTGSQV